MDRIDETQDDLIDLGAVTAVTRGTGIKDTDTMGLPLHKNGIADD